MECIKYIKNSFANICKYRVGVQMLMFTMFAYSSMAQTDSAKVIDSVAKISQQITVASTIKNPGIADKQIGKLPLKRSQLPELFLVIILLSIVAVLRYFFPKYLPELLQQTFSFSADSRVLKNDRIGDVFPGVFYNIMFVVLVTSLVLFYVNITYGQKMVFTWKHVSVVSFTIVSYLLVKTYLIKLISWVYKFHAINNVVMAYTILMRHVLALVFVPCIAFLLLINPEVMANLGLYIGLIAAAAIYLFHFFKMLVFVKKSSTASFVDIFTYLCCVEILPFCIVIVFFYRQLIHGS